jgi:hypothetical protein
MGAQHDLREEPGVMTDDWEADLKAEYRALYRETVRLYREAQAYEERMRTLAEPLGEVIAERLWREHPRWHRDRPTAQRRVSDLVKDGLRLINHGHDGYTSAALELDRMGDVVEGSVVLDAPDDEGE